MGGEELTVLSGMGGNLEYYGPDDLRWSAPRLLARNNLFGRVTPLSDLTELSGDSRPATLDEVRESYPVRGYQRLLRGTDVAGKPIHWVVSALFRRSDGPDIQAKKPLHELPVGVRLTFEEMEVLAPWLGLGLDKDGKTTVTHLRENSQDHNLQDGVDQVFETSFKWDDPQSIEALLEALVNFQLVRLGVLPNPRNLPTDFDEERMEQLIGVVEEQCLKLNPTARETVKEYAFYGLLGTPGVLFVAGAFHGASAGTGAFQGGISALLSPAKWTADFARRVAAHLGPKLAPVGSRLAQGTAGMGIVSRTLGAAGAVALGDFVGGLMVEGYARASGMADDPDYQLTQYAYDEMLADFAGRWTQILFGNILKGIQGGTALASDDFAEVLDYGLDRQIERLVDASNEFGDSVTGQLVDFVQQSTDSNNQIDSQVFRARVKALYASDPKVVKDAYNLLALIGHRVPDVQRIGTLIAPDGTIRDFGLLKSHLRGIILERIRQEPLLGDSPYLSLLVPLEGGGVKEPEWLRPLGSDPLLFPRRHRNRGGLGDRDVRGSGSPGVLGSGSHGVRGRPSTSPLSLRAKRSNPVKSSGLLRRPSTLLRTPRNDGQGASRLDSEQAQWFAKIKDSALKEEVRKAFESGINIEDFQRQGIKVLGRSSELQQLLKQLPAGEKEEFLAYIGMQWLANESISTQAIVQQFDFESPSHGVTQFPHIVGPAGAIHLAVNPALVGK